MTDMSQIVNDTATRVDDLITANETIRREALDRPEEDRDSMIAITMEFRKKRTPQQIMAIFFRMQALIGIVTSGIIEKWSLDAKADDGSIYVQQAVYEAAARCTVRFVDDKADAAFDPQEFLDLVLKHSDDEGRA